MLGLRLSAGTALRLLPECLPELRDQVVGLDSELGGSAPLHNLKSLEEYDKRLQEAMSKQQKPKIDIASAAVLNQLDRMGGGAQGGKKLIL